MPGCRDAKSPLDARRAEPLEVSWETRQDVKDRHRVANGVTGATIVFDSVGNACRLIVAIGLGRHMTYRESVASDEFEPG